MSSFELPDEMAIVAMSLAEREAFLRVLDRERRRAEARVALFVHAVASVGGHLDDSHRTPRAWGAVVVQLVAGGGRSSGAGG